MVNKTLLIAEDDHDFCKALTVRCTKQGFEVRTVSNARAALEEIQDCPPDVACLDIEMPPGNGLSVAEMIKSDDRLSWLPVVVLTGKRDAETTNRCKRLGIHYVSKGPDLCGRLAPLLSSLVSSSSETEPEGWPASPQAADTEAVSGADTPGAETTAQDEGNGLIDAVFDALGVNEDLLEVDTGGAPSDIPWVLTIDDDPDFTWALKKRLERYGVAVVRASDGGEGYRTAFTHPANVITLDFEMPNGQGDYVLRRLKDNPATRDIPVIVLTGKQDKFLERKMLGLGAARFMTKPYVFEDLLEELRKHIDLLPVAAHGPG